MKKIINIKDIDDFKNHPFLVERTNDGIRNFRSKRG